ncbi:MAG TPA: acyl-CoA dehydrogenase family protein [Gammaproteobacteria bacterium]|nr:acyl-CoA dehydrogenase family protein [Gammaproteobacteria bacterium]
MDLTLSDEQKLIRQAVERFIRNDYSFDARKKIIGAEPGYSTAHWQTFAELGWLGVPLPEAHGGFGGALADLLQVVEPFGAGMVVEPYLPSVILAGTAIAEGGSEAQQAELLPAIADGTLIAALAHGERQSRFNPHDVQTSARREGDAYLLDGQKTVVPGAPWAQKFIVSARTAGERFDAEGIGLFVVDADAAGLQVDSYRTADGARAGNVTLQQVRVPASAALGDPAAGLTALTAALDLGLAAACGEALGAMQAVYQRTLDYVKTRKQFDVPIGSFQVIQHRLVDMFTAVESSRSMLTMLAVRFADPQERARALTATKVHLGQNARYVAQQAVQLHGGIGMTEELDIGHYFRRLTLFCLAFGSTDEQLETYAAEHI